MSESDEEIQRMLNSIRESSPSKLVRQTRPEPVDEYPAEPLPEPPPRLDYRVPTPEEAIARCRNAWQKAFDEYMQKNGRKDGSLAECHAREQAAAAYRSAMPELAHWSGIRDFIACVAHGILIDAIPADRTGQLLYAAQTALALLPRLPTP